MGNFTIVDGQQQQQQNHSIMEIKGGKVSGIIFSELKNFQRKNNFRLYRDI